MRKFREKGPFRVQEKYRINHKIVASEVRLIDENGGMLGVMSSRQALEYASDKGLDLIEVAPNAKPPTCKMMDYGKWKYENKKKEKAAKKRQTVIVVKEVQIRPRTDQHDLNVKLRRAEKFLLEGNKVKVNLRFSGREMAHQDLGFDLVNKFAGMLKEVSLVETPPKREGRNLFAILAPDPIKQKEFLKLQKKAAAATSVKAPAVSKVPPAISDEASSEAAEDITSEK